MTKHRLFNWALAVAFILLSFIYLLGHMAAKDDEAATNSRKFVCTQLCGENAHCPEWNDDEVPSCYTKHGRKVKVASK